MGKEVEALLAIYDHTARNNALAHHIPPHVRVISAAYRHQGESSSKAVRFLKANKANRDTADVIDRNHVDRARDAFEKGVAKWEQTRNCDAIRAAGLDPRAIHQTFDDGILRALVEIRRRATERKVQFPDLLGADLFAAIVKREEARGKHPLDGILNVAQRLDEQGATPFQTINRLALMACCLPCAASDDKGMDERFRA